MNTRITIALSITCAVAACASHEGSYAPDCVAFEGSNISLADGRYVWERFTDQVVIGDDGEPVDPFPGFPKTGTYDVRGNTLTLRPDSGGTTTVMHVVTSDDKRYLLTGQQFEKQSRSNELDDCALVLQPDSEN